MYIYIYIYIYKNIYIYNIYIYIYIYIYIKKKIHLAVFFFQSGFQIFQFLRVHEPLGFRNQGVFKSTTWGKY